jgi:hypothetical protein
VNISLTYSNKCLLVLASFFIFLILAYNISFSETIKNRNEIHKKEVKLAWLKEKEKEIPFLKSKIELVEKAYKDGDSCFVRDKLTAFISDFSENNNCIVTEIPISSIYSNGTILIETNSFTIKGGFNQLLKLQSLIEKQFKLTAKIMSAHFFSIKENQTKHKSLYLTLVTQSFRETNKSKQ